MTYDVRQSQARIFNKGYGRSLGHVLNRIQVISQIKSGLLQLTSQRWIRVHDKSYNFFALLI